MSGLLEKSWTNSGTDWEDISQSQARNGSDLAVWISVDKWVRTDQIE